MTTSTPSTRKTRAGDAVTSFLRSVLATGPLPVKEIDRRAVEALLLPEGKSVSQSKPFRNARKALGVEPYQKDGNWWWALRAPGSSERAPEKACGNPKGSAEGENGQKGAPVADVALVPAVKTKKRHGERGPGVKTLLTRSALNAAAAHPDLTPPEFLLSVMRDGKAEARWRMDAAKALLPKPTAAPPGDGAMVIEHQRTPAETALIAQAERQADLRDRRELADLIDEPDPLSAEERAVLEALDARGDLMAALPAHLKPVIEESDEDKELRELLRSDWAEPPPRQTYENPSAHRQRLLTERHAPAERKAPPLEDGEDGLG